MSAELSFTHLHLHSTYSFLDGYGTPTQIADRLIELGHTAAAVTDHGNIYAHVAWQKTLRAKELKPLFGCEMYVVDDITERTRHQESLGADGLPHVTVIAGSEKGYQNLLKLVALSNREGFYYKPRIDWSLLAKYQEGLVVLSGCVGGYPSRLAASKGIEATWEFVMARRAEIEDYYIEIVPEYNFAPSIVAIPILWKVARSAGIPIVMTADSHFPRAEDHAVEDLMLCVGVGKTLKDTTRTLRLPEYQYMCSGDEMYQRFNNIVAKCSPEIVSWLGDSLTHDTLVEAIENSTRLADAIDFEIPRASKMVFPGLGAESAENRLWQMICNGLVERRDSGELPIDKWQEYIDRATYEWQTLVAKGFADYILTTTDIVQWAKAQNSLVMCRGSAGGCLVLWLIGCSETDPIRHGLSFERFYDVTRSDPPDIDVDFEHSVRPKVLEYIYERYGEENCAQLAAVSYLKAKNAVMDAARAYGIPDTEIRALTALLDSKEDDVEMQFDGLTGEAAAVLQKYPQLRIVQKMIGQARQSTIHACGMIIAGSPIESFAGLVHQNGQPRIASVDKRGISALGVLKVDLLSVASYDVVAETVRSLGKPISWLYTLPLDDTRVFAAIRNRRLAGIFQLDGAASDIAVQIGVSCFEEMYAASALCRPGPNAHTETYVTHKKNPERLQKTLGLYHPIAANIVAETYGTLLYQEQVMQLCRQLARMEWGDVNALRKRIAEATSDFHELGGDYKTKFIDGCLANGVSQQETEFWWNAIKTHGFYSFNKSHAATYGIVGYWMMYLKVYHPAAFYSTYLKLEGLSQSPNEMLIKQLMREWRELGGQVKVLDPQKSQASFSLYDNRTILGGWQNIKGIGGSQCLRLIQPPPKDWLDVSERIPLATLQRLFDAGICVEEYKPNKLAPLASWAPVFSLPQEALDIKEKFNLYSPEDLYRCPPTNDDWAAGYITLAYKKPRTGKFHGDVYLYVIEDPSGMFIARSSLKTNAAIGAKMRDELAPGQYIGVRGYWRDGTMYVSEFVVLIPA